MPHRRAKQRGSFGSHFDELVVQFPDKHVPHARGEEKNERPAGLQEKIDIHRLLFEHAWQLDRRGRGS